MVREDGENYYVHEDEPEKDVAAVQKFLRAVWLHPLLTQETLQHRKAGIELFNKYLKRNNLPEQDYVGVLTGSSLWMTNRKSDYDFLVICREGKDKEQLELSIEELSFIRYLRFKQLDISPGVIDKQDVEPIRGDRNKYALLLTPDEYI